MSNPQPPRWAVRLIEWYCKPYYADIILGDLFELYHRQHTKGQRSAGLRFVWNVIRFFRWRYIKSGDEFLPKTQYGMYNNYFKISFRNLLKHKGFASLNIAGLSVGLAGCLLIVVHLLNEYSYDKYYPEDENIYYVANGKAGRYTPAPMLSTMINELPEVVTGTRIWNYSGLVAKVDQNTYKLQEGLAADSSFFEIFPQTFIQGTPNTALNSPGSIVLTKTTARNIFGNDDPIGREIEIEGEKGRVTAIVADPPKNTTLPFDFLVDLPRDPFVTNGNWTGNNFFTYVKLIPNADILGINLQFVEFIKSYAKTEIESYGYTIEQYLEYVGVEPYSLVPLLDIHLHYPWLSQGPGGSIQQFWIMIIIAMMLLLIAIINYVNMTTAKATLRLREIGMRKVFGSQRAQIIRQFFVESYVITILSFLIGIGLAMAFLPYFNQLVQRSLEVVDLFTAYSVIGMLLLFVLTGLMAGFYPALYLSGFKPVNALKGEFAGSKVTIRKALVVSQFAISIMLISFTFIVYNQVRLMSEFDAGWNKEQTFAIFNMDAVDESYEVIKNELSSIPAIQSMSLTNMMPSQSFIANWNYSSLGEEGETYSPDNLFADANYLEVLDLELVQGRFFDESRLADSMSIVINETFAFQLGWDNPVGRKLTRGENVDFTIVGVVKDFYPTSVKRQIRPLVIRYGDKVNGQVSISSILLLRLEGSYTNTMKQITAIFEKYSEGYPFDGVFLSDSFNRLYENDQRFGNMFSTFSLLALFIASLGLISLAAYSLERRNKEIAVRKVLGANAPAITWLMIREYLILVGVASVIAVPGVYYYADYWLSNFANRVQIGWLIFALPIIVVILFTVLLVMGQTLKAAHSNPTYALKQE